MNRESAVLLTGEHMAVRRGRHGYLAYNLHDNVIAVAIDQFGEWAEQEISFLSRFILPGATVLDIGANIGPFHRLWP